MKKFKLENTRQHPINMAIRQDNGIVVNVFVPPATTVGATNTRPLVFGTAIVDEDMLEKLKAHLTIKGYFALGWLKVEDAPDDAVSDHDALSREEANDESKLNVNLDDLTAQVEAAQAAAKVATDAANEAQKHAEELRDRAENVKKLTGGKKGGTKIDQTAQVKTGDGAGGDGGPAGPGQQGIEGDGGTGTGGEQVS